MKVDIRGFPVVDVSRVITYRMMTATEMFKSVLIIARVTIHFIYV